MAAHKNFSTDAAAARDGDGEAALLRSGAGVRSAMTLIYNGTAGLYHPDVRTAAPTTKSGGGPYVVSPGVRAASQDGDGLLVLAPNENGTAAYLVDSHRPRTAAPDEDATAYYLDYDMHAAAAAKGNVHFFELPRRGVARCDSGVHAGEALALPLAPQVRPPLALFSLSHFLAHNGFFFRFSVLKDKKCSQVFGGKMTSVLPGTAVDVGQDKVAGAFTERLRRGLPVLGISVASLAVAGLAAGEPDPAAGFGLFLMLIVGLSAVTISVIRA
ncbi:unnamed protein product [Urochloa decumbens]|uniref:Uncharacterized protein n=1 Tax=Urochloa decumbens TaxID=240449 RepID=A0ABC9HEB0_9POAL